MHKNTAKSYVYVDETCIPFTKISAINKLYVPQTNGEISESIMQNWTKQAKECYEINSECARCSLKSGNYSFICQMPKIVKALLKTYGPPLTEDESD